MAARSTRVILHNDTQFVLRWAEDHLDHGIWTNPWFPPRVVAARATVEWRSESNGFATGTEGHVHYDVGTDPTQLFLHWDNPFIGANSYDQSGPTGFSVSRSGGRGDDATVDFTIRQTAGVWQPLLTQPGNPLSTAWLMTDGTVLAKEDATGTLWTLTPDQFGDYSRGAWVQGPASSTMSPDRRYFASAVLADGRLFVSGGEYVNNSSAATDSNATDVYDPVAQTWKSLTSKLPAAGWSQIGDAPSAVLADGRVLLGNFNSSATLFFDPATDTFAAGPTKGDSGSEETWALLPDGTVLAVQDSTGAATAEKYVPGQPAATAWTATAPIGITLTQVPFGNAVVPEMGPGLALPDGRAFFAGASGNTALYTPPSNPTAKGAWAAGKPFPNDATGRPYQAMDTPGALLPSGNVLLVASPNDIGASTTFPKGFPPGLFFFEYDGRTNTMTAAASPPSTSTVNAYNTRLLQLPDGGVLLTMGTGKAYVYRALGAPADQWRPVFDWWPRSVDAARTFRLWGRQFNGLSQCSVYGDDASVATNYPVVRLVSDVDATVRYGRTSGHSTMGVATGNSLVSTQLVAPATQPAEPVQLDAVANGIPSGGLGLLAESLSQPYLAVGSSPVVSHRPEQLDAYFVSATGAVTCVYGDIGQGWRPPFAISPAGSGVAGTSVAALSRIVDYFEVYWADRYGSIVEAWWRKGARWAPPRRITGRLVAPPGAPVAAVARRPELVDLFWVARDGAVTTMFWNGAGWSNPFAVTSPGQAVPGAPLAVVARRPEQLDVFWVAPDGAVRSVFWNPPSGWSMPFDIASPAAAVAGGHLSVTARQPDQLDVFWMAPDGALHTTFWNPPTGWAAPFAISAPAAGDAGGHLSAVTRRPEQLDVFWIGPNGSLQTTFWNPSTGWASPFAILPAGGALRGGRVAAVARLFEALEVCVVTPSTALGHMSWTPAGGWSQVDLMTAAGAGGL